MRVNDFRKSKGLDESSRNPTKECDLLDGVPLLDFFLVRLLVFGRTVSYRYRLLSTFRNEEGGAW